MITNIISNFQKLCIYINFFILLPISFILLQKARIHLNHWELNKQELAYMHRPKINDLNYIILFTNFLILTRLAWKKYVFKHLDSKFIKEPSKNETMSIKYEKIYTGSFKCVYFIFTSLWGLYLMYTSNYVPNLLGGNLSTEKFLNVTFYGLPFKNIESFHIKMYYFWNFSYHLMSTLFHFTQTNRKNWHEMTMHHIVTLILITFSYMLGIIKIGHIVMLLHDIPDIFVYSSKVLNELKNTKNLLIFSYIIGLVGSFAYFRIYVLSFNIIYPLTLVKTDYEYYNTCINYFNILLGFLLLLHIYWYNLILYMITKFILGHKITDKQEEYKR